MKRKGKVRQIRESKTSGYDWASSWYNWFINSKVDIGKIKDEMKRESERKKGKYNFWISLGIYVVGTIGSSTLK